MIASTCASRADAKLWKTEQLANGDRSDMFMPKAFAKHRSVIAKVTNSPPSTIFESTAQGDDSHPPSTTRVCLTLKGVAFHFDISSRDATGALTLDLQIATDVRNNTAVAAVPVAAITAAAAITVVAAVAATAIT